MCFKLQRGDIWMIDLGEPQGRLQGGVRPCIFTSNNVCNNVSPVVNVVPCSSKINKKEGFFAHIFIPDIATPSIRYFWKNRNNNVEGNAINKPIAI
jgi:hypothetical protein